MESKLNLEHQRSGDKASNDVLRLEVDRLTNENQQLRIDMAKASDQKKQSSLSKQRGSMYAHQDGPGLARSKRESGLKLLASTFRRKSKVGKLRAFFKFWLNKNNENSYR